MTNSCVFTGVKSWLGYGLDKDEFIVKVGSIREAQGEAGANQFVIARLMDTLADAARGSGEKETPRWLSALNWYKVGTGSDPSSDLSFPCSRSIRTDSTTP